MCFHTVHTWALRYSDTFFFLQMKSAQIRNKDGTHSRAHKEGMSRIHVCSGGGAPRRPAATRGGRRQTAAQCPLAHRSATGRAGWKATQLQQRAPKESRCHPSSLPLLTSVTASFAVFSGSETGEVPQQTGRFKPKDKSQSHKRNATHCKGIQWLLHLRTPGAQPPQPGEL